jgi:hypothetical protein
MVEVAVLAYGVYSFAEVLDFLEERNFFLISVIL